MLKKINTKLKKQKLNALLITDPSNVYYLSHFKGSFGQILITKNKNHLITDSRYLLRAKHEIKDNSIKILNITNAQVIINKYKNIGYEANHITISKLKKLKNIYPNINWIETSEIVEELRIKKNKEEIKHIKKAALIGDKIFKKLPSLLKINIKENEIAWKIECMIRELGGEKSSFPPIIAFGKNSAIPHHESGNTKLKKGDMVLFDFGVKYKNYCSDMSRMIFTASPKTKQRKIYNIVLEAQLKSLQAVKAGIKVKQLDKIARDYITKRGYGDNFGHALGHGVGINIHEAPSFNSKNNKKLEEGMIITIEPGIYLEGWGGIRIEDMVVVTKNGSELLTYSKK